ncbi:hypothetical protein F0U44_19675 [Nocardioides humilatus]|uniref:Uncharacterized protein n=1 Tax=Nocardioides humilatus TaxID=2607660 RepID=A0A5B1L7V8_9ACTN|nr:hypothetical protein [Nocardioides humilatus]KAA1415860.1 hypothetical protein F0U44_19675 [Nocardioides humilatus]
MKRSIAALAATLITAGSVLTACGGGAPSADDISDSLQDKGGLDAKLADCIADKLVDSDLSDDQLNALADDDQSDLDADEVAEITDEVAKATTDCAL